MTNYNDILTLLRDGVSADTLAADFSKLLNEAEKELKAERENEAAIKQSKINEMSAVMEDLDNYVAHHASAFEPLISAIEIKDAIKLFDTAKVVDHGNGTTSYHLNFWGADIVFTIGKGLKKVSIGTTTAVKVAPDAIAVKVAPDALPGTELCVNDIKMPEVEEFEKALNDAKKTVSSIFGMKESEVDRIINSFIKDIDLSTTVHKKNCGCKK